MCVKTMVLIRPMRADSQAAIGNDTRGQDPGKKNRAPAWAGVAPKRVAKK